MRLTWGAEVPAQSVFAQALRPGCYFLQLEVGACWVIEVCRLFKQLSAKNAVLSVKKLCRKSVRVIVELPHGRDFVWELRL